MTSKRERKKWLRILEQQERLLDLHLANLMVEELKFDAKIRRACLRMAKKRKVGYIQ